MARRYANLDPNHRQADMRMVLRWGVTERLLGRRRPAAAGPAAPRVAFDRALLHDTAGAPRVTWIGHAGFLGSLAGGAFLVDPHFSPRAGVVVRRHVAPGLLPADLPPIDALMISHCHYDHMDKASIKALPRDVRVVVPEGVGRWFRRWGFSNIAELGWWQSAQAGPLRITLVPARHWARRWIHDTNQSLWGGFVIEGGGQRIYHSGDSAWFDGFAEIGRRFPGLLAAMLPVGGYEPAWFMENHHMNPEQACQAFLDVGAKHFVPMHWGTFKLTDETLAEPVERVRSWWRRDSPDNGRRLHVPAVGETVVFDG